MNRRAFSLGFSTIVASFATMRTIDARPDKSVKIQASEFNDLSLSQAMFAGMIATWDEVMSDGIERFLELGEDIDVTSERWRSSMRKEASLWSALYEDVHQFEAPEPFTEAFGYMVDWFESLDRASFLLIIGIDDLDSESIDESGTYVAESVENMESYRDALPFELPKRSRLAAQASQEESALPTTIPSPTEAPPKSIPTPEDREDGSTAFSIDTRDIKFEPREITIPADTDVEITVTNLGVLQHDFTIDKPNIATKLLNGGDSEVVIVNVPAGTYDFYCSVPGHKEAGMVGTLTVQ